MNGLVSTLQGVRDGYPMKFIDLNREGGIGANSLYCELGPFKFLVDAGLHPKQVGFAAMPDFERIDDIDLDLVILSHCHLDHLGSLPVVMENHPEAAVLMSLPSVTLAERMLHNSCNVMKRQGSEFGIEEYPLFTHGDIDRLRDRFRGIKFDRPEVIKKDGEALEVTIFSSGHVVGAAGVQIVYKKRRIFFSGDVLFEPQRILKGAHFPPHHFDTIVLETTRGATERAPEKTREQEVERLLQTVNETLQGGGSCLIPVFALGRMQEILTIIRDARESGDLVEAPVFCSGLGMDLADYFDQISKRTGLVDFRRKVLKDLKVKPLPRNLKPGRDLKHNAIYVVSSGMLVEHTPSYQVASCILGYERNAICYVGYCDPDTPGGKMLDAPDAEAFAFDALDYTSPMNARIERFELSGHADRDELIEFAMAAEPRAIVLTHGDPPAREWFRETIQKVDSRINLLDPEPGAVYEV